MEFLKLFRLFIQHHSTSSVLYDKRKPKTVAGYTCKYNTIAAFLLSKGLIKINALDFTLKLSKEYFAYLSAHYSHNYAVRNVEICRTVLDYGLESEALKYNPLSSLSLKKTGPGKPVSLDQVEVDEIENYQPTSSMIRKARKMFLFQCYTGMDYGDLVTFNINHIVSYKNREFIIKKRAKTGVEACVPFMEKAKNILGSDHMVEFMSNAKYNKALKEIAKDCSITKRLTSHIGRKTYAMLKLNQEGYSIEAVSRMVGHKSIKTTETYYAQVEIDLIYRELERKLA